MKEELKALQELFVETVNKYGLSYATMCFTNGGSFMTIQTKRDGNLIDIDYLEE